MARFAGTSYLNMAAPATVALPFTVMAWVKPTSTAAMTVFSLGPSGSTSAIRIRSTGGQIGLDYGTGGTSAGNAALTSGAINTWTFVVARNISTTNRRIGIAKAEGSGFFTQVSTTSITTGTLNQARIGAFVNATEPYSGEIAEFCYLDADVQPDNLNMNITLLRQLAFNGPWSIPRLHPSIVEYRRLWQTLGSETELGNSEVYQRGGSRAWVTTGGVDVGDAPPIHGGYIRPNQSMRMVMI